MSSAPARSASSPPRSRKVADTRVVDTITDDRKPVTQMLPGFKPAIPVVFCGCSGRRDDFETLRAAMGKLRLNDASFSFEMETSADWASGSAAASSACCLSRSSRSGCIANSIST